MMYLALGASAILLLVVNLIAWRAKRPIRPILGCTFLFGFFSVVNCVILPPVTLQAILLCIIGLIWGESRARPRYFLVFSCAATLIAFAIPGYLALRETRHLQEAFPYASMDDRLPLPRRSHLTAALPPEARERLGMLEARLEDQEQMWKSHYRTYSLRKIHENTVQLFAEQAGFGVGRMIGVSEYKLKEGAYQGPPIPQPGIPSASPWLPELLQSQQEGSKPPDDLLSLHRVSVVDFVNVAGFGYIKDRQHVAGFQEHQVSQTPAPARPWKLQTLDLVGLLLHERPIAYVSKNLPRMKELCAAPIRELDEFEAAGLPTLQQGDDLFVRERVQERRMLGAIRATRQCLSCHEAERGDLLGAFSYRMTQDGK